MEFKTFGDQNKKTVMLIHGNLMCWRQFEETIPYLEKHFRVIAVSMDGFDEMGKTTFACEKKPFTCKE